MLRQARRATLRRHMPSLVAAALLASISIGSHRASAADAAAPSRVAFALVDADGALRGRPPPSSGGPQAPSMAYTLLLPPPAPTPPTPLLPLVLLLNGANVESRWYSGLAARLASAGYPVALGDAYRGVPAALRGQASGPEGGAEERRRARNGCPSSDFVLAANAGLLRALLRAADGESGGGGGSVGLGGEGGVGGASSNSTDGTSASAAAAAGSGGLSAPPPALSGLRLRERGVVLLGHSFGGAAAASLLGGRCAPPPPPGAAGSNASNASSSGSSSSGSGSSGSGGSSSGTATNSSSPAAAAAADAARPPLPDAFSLLCGRWQPEDRDLALVRGAVLLEGYPSAPPALDLGAALRAAARATTGGGSRQGSSSSNSSSSSTSSPSSSPPSPSPFVLFLNGEFNARVRASYDATAAGAAAGAAASGGGVVVGGGGGGGSKGDGGGACVAYARFRGLNHYLGVDWVDPQLASREGGNSSSSSSSSTGGSSGSGSTTTPPSRQVTPCGATASSDAPDFAVSRQAQEAGTANIASLIDAFVRAHALGDPAAERRLRAAEAKAGGGGGRAGATAAAAAVAVPPGEALELLRAGPGCRFGGGPVPAPAPLPLPSVERRP